MKKVFLILFFATLLGVSGWLFYYFYQRNQKPPVVFKTDSPFISNIVKKTVATGSIVPRKEINVKPQVSGILEKLYVLPGEMVKAGQLIGKIRVIPNMANLNNAESSVRRAEISEANSKIELDRQTKLFKAAAVSEQEYLRVKQDYALAKETMDAAKENLQIIKEGATKDATSSTTLVRATVSGMLLDVPFKEGSSVIESNTFNEGSTVAIIADMGEMIFQGKVDEAEVGKLKKDMPLDLKVGAIEGVTFKAKLEYVAPKGVTEDGAIKFEIKAQVELQKDYFLRAGYSANADIVLEKHDSVLVLKESLITFSKDTAFVEVQTTDQVFEKRQIKTGISDGINIEVLTGLTKDDKLKIVQ